MSPLLIIAGCTATRPSATIGKKPLLYNNVQSQLFLPLTKGKPPIITTKLSLKNIKRSSGKSREKIFTFYEEDNLSCSAMLYILALAFSDIASTNKFASPKALYNLVVPPGQVHIRLRWDET